MQYFSHFKAGEMLDFLTNARWSFKPTVIEEVLLLHVVVPMNIIWVTYEPHAAFTSE